MSNQSVSQLYLLYLSFIPQVPHPHIYMLSALLLHVSISRLLSIHQSNGPDSVYGSYDIL